MADLTYGAGIKMLIQAEAIANLLAKAKDALVLADQLEPKIQELSRIKSELTVEVGSLEVEKTVIITETREEKAKIVAQQTSELATKQVKADKVGVESKQKLQGELDQLTNKVESKTKELEVLEKTFRERKSILDSEILSSEKRLADVTTKIEALKAKL